MKVKDLITKLNCFDPEAEVVSIAQNFELNKATVKINIVAQYNKATKKDNQFMDAFDGTPYTHETYNIHGDGEEKVVFIGAY